MKKEIKISEVLEMIDQGKTRPEIREHYSLTVREMEALNNHPQIKGKKAKTPINLVIVDDVSSEEQTESTGQPLAELEIVTSSPEGEESLPEAESLPVTDFLEEENDNAQTIWEN